MPADMHVHMNSFVYVQKYVIMYEK